MRLARRWPFAIAIAGALAIPSLAHAATYCVNAPGCSGTPETTLQAALTAAMATTTEADTVQVGDPGPPAATGYVYSDSGVPANQVAIVGAGPASTVLTRTAPGDVLTLIGPGSTLSGATLQMPAGSADAVATSGSLDNVNVTTLDSGSGNQTVADFIGAGPAEHWIGGSATLPNGAGTRVGVVDGMTTGTRLDLENLSIAGPTQGIIGGAATSTAVRRVSLASAIGFIAQGDQMTLDNVAFRVTATPGIFAVANPSAGHNAALDLNRVTAFGDGEASGIGLIVGSGSASESALTTVRNSIIRNFFFDYEREATASGAVANLSASYSDIALVHGLSQNSSGGLGSVSAGPGLVDDDPRLANPAAGDFSLPAGSPAIDAGDPAGFLPGDSATDVLGAPRISNGRQDMGAVEFQAPAPVPPPAKDTTAPSVKLAKLPKKLTLSQLVKGFSFSVSPNEPSSIVATLAGSASSVKLSKSFNFTLAQKKLGLRAGKRKVTLKVKKRLLGHSRRFSVRLTVLATDASGNKQTVKRTIKVHQ
jgi:hypothetical protein